MGIWLLGSCSSLCVFVSCSSSLHLRFHPSGQHVSKKKSCCNNPLTLKMHAQKEHGITCLIQSRLHACWCFCCCCCCFCFSLFLRVKKQKQKTVYTHGFICLSIWFWWLNLMNPHPLSFTFSFPSCPAVPLKSSQQEALCSLLKQTKKQINKNDPQWGRCLGGGHLGSWDPCTSSTPTVLV